MMTRVAGMFLYYYFILELKQYRAVFRSDILDQRALYLTHRIHKKPAGETPQRIVKKQGAVCVQRERQPAHAAVFQ